MSSRILRQTSVPPETIHKWLSALICVLNSLYFVLNMLIIQKLGLGSIHLTVAVFSGYCFFTALKKQYKPWHSYTLMVILTANILVSASIMDLIAGATYWGLALPLWYYSLFGLKKGFVFSAILVILSATVIFLKTDTNMFMPYRTTFNFTLVFCSIWIMCHLYEVQRQKTSNFLHSLALQDDLTDLQNRHALKADFQAFHNNFESMHMLIIDIDYFKGINDKYGHDIGDSVLINVANVLKKRVQSKEIYRLGGEEFVVLYKDISDVEAHEKAEKIRVAIEENIFNGHKEEIKLTISIGISSLQPEHEFVDFLRATDQKLYQAKREGRNRVCA